MNSWSLYRLRSTGQVFVNVDFEHEWLQQPLGTCLCVYSVGCACLQNTTWTHSLLILSCRVGTEYRTVGKLVLSCRDRPIGRKGQIHHGYTCVSDSVCGHHTEVDMYTLYIIINVCTITSFFVEDLTRYLDGGDQSHDRPMPEPLLLCRDHTAFSPTSGSSQSSESSVNLCMIAVILISISRDTVMYL